VARPIRTQDDTALPRQAALWDERPERPALPGLAEPPELTKRPELAHRFLPATQPGPHAELLLVEGDSALASVAPLRDVRRQGVLALQGKPLNAWTARPERVAAHPQYRQLADVLGLPGPTALAAAGHAVRPAVDAATGITATPGPHPALQRYGRLVLLFDPDADGIHIGALMLLYVLRWLPGVIEAGALWQVRPPMFELAGADDGELRHASHPAERDALAARMAAEAGGRLPRIRRYRGLGNLAPGVLREQAVNPATRRAHRIDPAGAQAMRQMLTGGA
jgi:DNA gyrase/topoisomerase IV subunit B